MENATVVGLGGTGVRSVLHDTYSDRAKLESLACLGREEVDVVLRYWEICGGSF